MPNRSPSPLINQIGSRDHHQTKPNRNQPAQMPDGRGIDISEDWRDIHRHIPKRKSYRCHRKRKAEKLERDQPDSNHRNLYRKPAASYPVVKILILAGIIKSPQAPSSAVGHRPREVSCRRPWRSTTHREFLNHPDATACLTSRLKSGRTGEDARMTPDGNTADKEKWQSPLGPRRS
jgi:hypothetical protein